MTSTWRSTSTSVRSKQPTAWRSSFTTIPMGSKRSAARAATSEPSACRTVWRSSSTLGRTANLGDPNYNHTRFLDTDNGANLTPASNLGNIVDGGWHQVGVTWDSQAHTLRYWVDGKLGGTLTGDIATQFLGGQTTAYVGFTGATGGAHDVQQVRVAAVDASFANISLRQRPRSDCAIK